MGIDFNFTAARSWKKRLYIKCNTKVKYAKIPATSIAGAPGQRTSCEMAKKHIKTPFYKIDRKGPIQGHFCIDSLKQRIKA
jgi:hypothetical protein